MQKRKDGLGVKSSIKLGISLGRWAAATIHRGSLDLITEEKQGRCKERHFGREISMERSFQSLSVKPAFYREQWK